jgi:hypothetical protein
MIELVSSTTPLPAGFINAFAILYGFGPIVGLRGREGTGSGTQCFEPLGLAGLAQTVNVGRSLFQPLGWQTFQLLDNCVDRAHRV